MRRGTAVPLALYERVRRAMKDHTPEHGAHCECPCCDVTSALENYADEIAALEAKLGQVSAERSHWYRVAQSRAPIPRKHAPKGRKQMRTFEEIRASLNDLPNNTPKENAEVKIKVIGFDPITVLKGGGCVHLRNMKPNIALTRGESLDLAAALIYFAQTASEK